MKFTTLIPIRYNDGRKVPSQQIRQWLHEIAVRFGGCTDEGKVKGQWIDPADASHYKDVCRRISVVCDRIMLDEARETVIEIGKALKQRAMYFEVRDYDGVQLLEIPVE